MIKVIIPLAHGFEETEAVTIIDLLRRAGIKVVIAGIDNLLICGSHDIRISADLLFNNANPEHYDALILAGGQPGTANLKNEQKILQWLRSFHQQGKVIGAICAAPTVLLEAGITVNKRITSYPSEKAAFADSQYVEQNVVVDNNIITSRGVGTAIEFALALISRLKDPQTAKDIAGKILAY